MSAIAIARTYRYAALKLSIDSGSFTIQVLENTLGTTLTGLYAGVGEYRISAASPVFTSGKTAVLPFCDFAGPVRGYYPAYDAIGVGLLALTCEFAPAGDVVVITCQDAAFAAGIDPGAPLIIYAEIRVWP